MSYEPTNWQNGDIVTASKLNNIEQGIEILSEAKGTADTLLDGATSEDAGKIVTINSVGEAVLTPYAEMYGSPLAARTPEGMTDTSRIYVYSGETGSGYTQGYWYFYNGSSWEEGGMYEGRADLTTSVVNDGSKIPTSKAVYDEFKHFIDLIYPVGSLYFSTSPTNPSTYLGGNWIRYAEGKTIFGASSTDEDFKNTEVEGVATEIKTGGSKVTAYAVGGPNGHNHVTGSENYQRFVLANDTNNKGITGLRTSGNSSGDWIVPAIEETRDSRFATSLHTEFSIKEHVEGYGSVFTANNLPPYVSCYVWMRVADNYSPLILSQNTHEYPIENVFSAYHDRVVSVANSVRSEINASDKWVHAIFITDMHASDDPAVRTNSGHSQAIAMYLAANTGVDKIVLGGDYCLNEWKESRYKAYVSDFINAGFSDYIYPLSGNHERMLTKTLAKDIRNDAFPDSGFVAAQSRATLCNDFLLSKNNIVGNIQEGYYYIDDEDSKARFLFINTCDEAKYSVSDNQLRWIQEVGVESKNKTDWTLIIFGHVNLYPAHLENNEKSNQVEAKNGAAVVNALKLWRGKIAGYFCGHQHLDSHYVENGINHTVLYCDRFSSHTSDKDDKYKPNRPAKREIDTITDSAVTVISINLAARRVVLRRIGAGAAPLNFQFGSNQTFEYHY